MPRAIEGVPHGTHFGGDYGFPRYGGRSRVSRYGIDYGDLHARRRGRHYGLRSSEGSYGPWPGALTYGAFGYPEVYGQTYPRWTGPFGGREHPTTFDPYLANLYYRNPFIVNRLMSWYPYLRS
uniref:Glycine rich superfamily member n=1 Tax=Rhipicephalus zambeziensis TaxID=60191 RepID=A0A224Y3T2_9ACAR